MEFYTPDTIAPPRGYSHAVSVEPGRRLVFTAGQIGVLPDGSDAVGFEAQVRQTYANLEAALAAAGATFADVVKLTGYVLSTDELPLMRAIRDEYVDTASPPPFTLIKVAGLARPELLVEIEAIAAV